MASIFSPCRHETRMPRVVTPRMAAHVVMVMAVLMVFGIGHLRLRFCLGQLKSDTARLQTLQATLHSQISQLTARTGEFKRSDSLLAYAREELGMVPLPPEERRTIQLPEETVARYATVRGGDAPAAPAEASSLASAGEVWLNALGDRLGLIEAAQAAEKADRAAQSEAQVKEALTAASQASSVRPAAARPAPEPVAEAAKTDGEKSAPAAGPSVKAARSDGGAALRRTPPEAGVAGVRGKAVKLEPKARPAAKKRVEGVKAQGVKRATRPAAATARGARTGA